jgi:tetratricopeptide (TPR) repeat protein
LRDVWPAKAIRRPTVEIEALNDEAIESRLGAAVAGMIRGRVNWRKDRFGVGLVSGQAGLTTALSGLGDVSGDAKAAVAVVQFLTALLPRRRFTLMGELQSESAEGRGISIEFKSERGYEALITFWANALAVDPKATPTEVYRSLAVASAAWADHWATTQLLGGELLTKDPQSWALFRCGVDAQRLGDEERALVLYDRALVMDGTNAGAMANLGVILCRKNDWDDARRNLHQALLATEDPNVTPKLEHDRNPDWYRIKYQLAKLHMNWAGDSDAPEGERGKCAVAARKESIELAQRTLAALETPPSDGVLAPTPSGYVEQTLLPFLEGTIEPSALALVACMADPMPDAPTAAPQERPSREELLASLREGSIDPWRLISYVELGEHLTPSAHYDLACFYVKAGKIWKATRRLQKAIRETAPPERKGLIGVVRSDPMLARLRAIRPGLLAKLEGEFLESSQRETDLRTSDEAKEFDLQGKIYKRLLTEGWDVRWMDPESRFTFQASKGPELLVVALAKLAAAVKDDQITLLVGARAKLGGETLLEATIWLFVHADVQHEFDVEAAEEQRVEINPQEATA